jgi:large conductance mechanosensitive channel
MALLEDFRKFAFKGNVIDLAVGVVIGAAFGKIVTALVSDIVMPLVALIMPSGNWRSAGIVLREAADPKDNVILKYGDLLGATIDFLIIAFVLFIVVSKIVKATEARLAGPPAPEPAPTTKPCPYCCEAVPIAATRCRACTSDLGSVKA